MRRDCENSAVISVTDIIRQPMPMLGGCSPTFG